MNLHDLSKVVLDSMDECIRSKVDFDNVEIYIGDGSCASEVNRAQLRFSSNVPKTGILLLDSID